MSDPAEPLDPYAVLEVQRDADAEAIRDAYRRKAQQYHPDKVVNLGPEIRALAESKMREINAAYDLLNDAAKRSAFDSGATNQQTQESPASAQPRPSASVVWEAYVAAARTGEPSRRTVGVFVVVGALIVILTTLLWYRTRDKPGAIETAVTLTVVREYLANGQPEEALTILQRIATGNSVDRAAWNLRWQTETRLGLYADAEGSLSRSVELDPTNARLRVELAKVLFRREKVDETRAQLAWLSRNAEASVVVVLLEDFRRENPKRAERLAQSGAPP